MLIAFTPEVVSAKVEGRLDYWCNCNDQLVAGPRFADLHVTWLSLNNTLDSTSSPLVRTGRTAPAGSCAKSHEQAPSRKGCSSST